MRIWGKLLGFIFGFMLSKNLFGALIGMFIGHTFDKGRGLDFSNLSAPATGRHRERAGNRADGYF